MVDYKDVLPDDASLVVFLRNLRAFDRKFCDAMSQGLDFTLRLEVRGNHGRLAHCRVSRDDYDRISDPPQQGAKAG